ncbi:pyrroline-5-carboxylate reductase [Candidatus Neptunochlamydia vexilliferae]|uniref:Pyrroline-5-carboxylate reductase n=1 Tax=Candidatus Neptunichlamydia vexilliferae TaxID=1651774 RepID=A0ABS0AXI1_9BACT|nr:pyrroline-5-carboxylate reductase [Candidatus Neptunochlamydia vexilliferae]MBF5058847.1 Pyrroline-5-carboxylate reductase [Candidatus Neptunochlamydia vexilliferae]
MKVGVIGCGVMGNAMARRMAKKHEVALYSRSSVADLAQEIGAKACTSLKEVADHAEALVLAVKPHRLEEVAEELEPLMKQESLLLSVLGGISLANLKEHFSRGVLFRVMPNLPLLCGKGMIGVAEDPQVAKEDQEKVNQVLEGMGTTVWLKEELMNPFTALTGCNPAFIYLIIEAMVEAGISMGIKQELAEDYVLKTIEGAVALFRDQGDSLQSLRWKIASPGGSTIAGLQELEKERVRYALMRGIQRANEKSHESDLLKGEE